MVNILKNVFKSNLKSSGSDLDLSLQSNPSLGSTRRTTSPSTTNHESLVDNSPPIYYSPLARTPSPYSNSNSPTINSPTKLPNYNDIQEDSNSNEIQKVSESIKKEGRFVKEIILKDLTERYYHMECIGSGRSAVVLKANRKNDHQLVALKVIIRRDSDDNHYCDPYKEFRVTNGFNSNRILKHYRSTDCNISKAFVIEMEYFGCGTLSTYFPKSIPSEKMLLSITSQIVEALYLLEKHEIVHNDIKPNNILVRSINLDRDEIDLAVGDFELANISNMSSVKGMNANFNATDDIATSKSDIYSLGATLSNIIKQQSQQTIPTKTYDYRITELIKIMLNKNPNDRPSIAQIKKTLENLTT